MVTSEFCTKGPFSANACSWRLVETGDCPLHIQPIGRFRLRSPVMTDTTTAPLAAPPDPDALLTTIEAAALLGVSLESMTRWRIRRKGPRWSRIGEGRGLIRYRRSDLAHYVTSVTVPAATNPEHD